MKKKVKSILIVVIIILMCFIVDFICIFAFHRPLFAIKGSIPYKYTGLIYDVYNCPEYSSPKVKSKGIKFSCSVKEVDNGKLDFAIIDKMDEQKDLTCASALQNFYTDDNYSYYWSCMKDEYIVVRYKDGKEEKVSDALKNKKISIADLDRFNIQYGKEDNKINIETKINYIIENGPLTSSNPFDYINANKNVYDDLLDTPKETFEYVIKDLIQTNGNNGLKGYIEALLCNDIKKSDYEFDSASNFINKYIKSLQECENSNSCVFSDYDLYALNLYKTIHR